MCLGDIASVRSLNMGEADRSSSPVSWPLPSLAWPLPTWLPIEFNLPAGPALAAGRGANDGREVTGRVDAGASLVLGPAVADMDCLDVLEAGIGGGPIEVRLPPTLGRGFEVVTDDTRPFEGVPVLGVDAAEVPADPSCFVGDFVGDFEQD
jgi:hypothetical protein